MRKLHGVALRRTRIYPLFAQGLRTDEVVRQLCMRYHKEATEEEVRDAYFPKRGQFAVDAEKLGGAGRKELLAALDLYLAKYRKMKARIGMVYENPEFAAKRLEGVLNREKNPEFVRIRNEKSVENITRYNTAPEYEKTREEQKPLSGSRLKALFSNPEWVEKFSKKHSELLKSQNKDGEFSAKRLAALRKKWEEPGYRQKMSENLIALSNRLWQNPEHKEKMSKLAKTRWEDTDFREKMRRAQALFWDKYLEKKAEMLATLFGTEFGWVEGDRVPIFKTQENFIFALMLRDEFENAMKALSPFQMAALANEYWLGISFDARLLLGRSEKALENAVREALEILRNDANLRAIYEDIAVDLKRPKADSK